MAKQPIKLRLKGLGCANCANKIEAKTNGLDEVEEAVINFSTTVLDVTLKDDSSKEESLLLPYLHIY